ncbi:MAG: CsbD family protein [Acidobacteriota bacterium]
MWNEDEVEGKGKKIKGTIKDKVGELIGDKDLEAEGEAEHAAGDLQEKGGTVRRKVGEVVEDVGKVIGGKR